MGGRTFEERRDSSRDWLGDGNEVELIDFARMVFVFCDASSGGAIVILVKGREVEV